MYAIVDIAGQQFKVKKNERVYVHRLEAKEGEKVEFNNVLLIDNEGKVQVGTPVIDGARVAATVLSHLKGDKVIVFKKKRRKGFKRMNGHRQYLTQILVQGILAKGETLKEEAAPVKKTKKTEVSAETAEVKPKAVKKVAAKKAATKKSTKKSEE